MASKIRWTIIAVIVIVIVAVATGAIYFFVRPTTAPSSPTPVTAKSPVPDAQPELSHVSAATPISVPPVPSPEPTAPPARMPNPEVEEIAFSGRITDLHGKPVPGARVIFVSAHMSFTADREGRYFAAVPTGMRFTEDGVDPTPGPALAAHEFYAGHDDYSDSDRITVSPAVKEINFTLKPLGAIEGRVVAARTGAPVTDFRIRSELSYDPAPTTPEAEFKRVRDPAGHFKLDRIKAGTGTITVGAKGFADLTMNFPPVLAGETRERVEVRLEPGAVLQGQVVDTNGRGVRMAQVSGGYPRRGAVSNSEGAFRLDSLPNGPFEVTVKHENFPPKTLTVVLSNGSVSNTRIVLNAGAVIDGEFTVGGQPVRGHVNIYLPSERQPTLFTPDGRPIHDTDNYYTRANAEGRYRLTGLPVGPVEVTGTIDMQTDACMCTWRKTIKIDVVPDATQTVDFNFPASEAIVEGTVYEAPKRPAAGRTTVSASYADFTLSGDALFHVEGYAYEGGYGLCLPSGPAQLQLVAAPEDWSGAPYMAGQSLDLKPGARVTQDFQIYGGATLRVSSNNRIDLKTTFAIAIHGEVEVPKTITKDFGEHLPVASRNMEFSKGILTISRLDEGTYTIVVLRHDESTEAATVLASKVVHVKKDEKMDVALQID